MSVLRESPVIRDSFGEAIIVYMVMFIMPLPAKTLIKHKAFTLSPEKHFYLLNQRGKKLVCTPEKADLPPKVLRLHMPGTAELTAPYSLFHYIIPSVNQRPSLQSHI